MSNVVDREGAGVAAAQLPGRLMVGLELHACRLLASRGTENIVWMNL